MDKLSSNTISIYLIRINLGAEKIWCNWRKIYAISIYLLTFLPTSIISLLLQDL